jgi:cold-inducible RNA-binding protein
VIAFTIGTYCLPARGTEKITWPRCLGLRTGFSCYLLNLVETEALDCFLVDCRRILNGGSLLLIRNPTPGDGSVTTFENVMKLYVGNLSFSTNESALRDLFSAHGAVTDVHIVTDRMSGKSRGFAFVTMGNRNEGQAAINALEGHLIDGRNLAVSEARPKNDDRASGDFQRRRR